MKFFVMNLSFVLLLSSCSGISPKKGFRSIGSAQTSIAGQMEEIKTSISCKDGYRLKADVKFYNDGKEISINKIKGEWHSGSLINGSANKLWIGVSSFNDLMFVTEVVDGEKVLGFNISLSYCEIKSTYSALPSLVSNERILDRFQTPNGIIIGSSSSCGLNVVSLASNTTIVSNKNLDIQNSELEIKIPTTFASPACE